MLLRHMASYHDQTLSLPVCDQRRRAVVRTPKELAGRAALLINLASDTEHALDGELFRVVPAIFLAAGHRVASFDLPHHGAHRGAFGGGLAGWAAAARAGVDVFGDIRDTGRALIDLCLQHGLAREEAIVLSGTSRGALAALHVMSADTRVLAAAVHWPVTHLPALREFSGLEANPIIERANAQALLPNLADRHVFIAIGSVDPRVDAAACARLYEGLRSLAATNAPELFTGPGATHAKSCADPHPGRFPMETGYHAGAGFLLQQCAKRLKLVEPASRAE